MGKFYGIGTGPGDPELITLKAFNILKKADVIFVPKARMKGDSVARDIVEKVLEEEKEFVELEFPMTKDEKELRTRYLNAAELIIQRINNNNLVAYLTIGDPLLYSTYIYLLNALMELSPGLGVETIPGITAYSAVASEFDFSMAEKDEKICICPVPADMEELRKTINVNDTVVIMKVAKKLPEVINLLRDMDLLRHSVFGSRAGLKGEKLVDGRKGDFALSEKEGYLSTIIVRNRKK